MRLVLVVMALAACATPEQRAEKIEARYGPVCESLGVAKGSEKHLDCALKLREQHIIEQN